MDSPQEIPQRVQVAEAIERVAAAMEKLPKNSKPWKRLETLLNELCTEQEHHIPPAILLKGNGDNGGSADGPQFVRHRRGSVSSL